MIVRRIVGTRIDEARGVGAVGTALVRRRRVDRWRQRARGRIHIAHGLGGQRLGRRCIIHTLPLPRGAWSHAPTAIGTGLGFLIARATTRPETNVSAATRWIAAPSPTKSATAPERSAPTA